MIYKDFSLLTEKEKYKLTKGSIIPRPIAWISTMSANNTLNLAPFSYFNMISSHHLMVSILRKSEGMKDTAVNLQQNKEAVVHITTKNLLPLVDETSRGLAYGESEVKGKNLTFVESQKIAVLGIAEAPIRFETVVKEQLTLKENEETISDVFILEILAAHFNETVYDQKQQYILSEQLEPLARLGGPEYATIVKINDYVRKY